MAWIEQGLLKQPKGYALSMEDKMAAGAFGRATIYGGEGSFNLCYFMHIY